MQTTHHMYKGADEEFWGKQNLNVPGFAMDDIFGFVHVTEYRNGDLTIRRFSQTEKGVLLAPQKRTCGHVRRVHKEKDGDPPFVSDVVDEKAPGQAKKKRKNDQGEQQSPPSKQSRKDGSPSSTRTEFTTPPSQLRQTPATPGNKDSPLVDYPQFVADLDLNSQKSRKSIRNTEPKVTKWATRSRNDGVTTFAGFDDMPLRAPMGSPAEIQNKTKLVKVACPGVVHMFHAPGGLQWMTTLCGFQVKNGSFYALQVPKQFVLKQIGKHKDAMESPSTCCVKMLVNDLFENAQPEPVVDLTFKQAAADLADKFLHEMSPETRETRKREDPLWKRWDSIKTLKTAAYLNRMRKNIENQQKKNGGGKEKKGNTSEKKAS